MCARIGELYLNPYGMIFRANLAEAYTFDEILTTKGIHLYSEVVRTITLIIEIYRNDLTGEFNRKQYSQRI